MWDKKRSRFLIQSLIILLISMIILGLMMSMVVQNPPLDEFITYEMITESAPEIAGNDLYIQKLIVAEHFKNAALSEWKAQDSRWLFLRNYNEARRMMIVAISIVEEVSSGTIPQNEASTVIPTQIIWPDDPPVKEFPKK